MAPALSLNIKNTTSCLKEKSEKWLTRNQIDHSNLEPIVRQVYLSQLEELQSMLAVAGERSVDQFVAAEEMHELTTAFWLAVRRARLEKEAKAKAKWEKKAKRVEKAKKGVEGKGKDGEAAAEEDTANVIGTFRGGEAAATWRAFRSGKK